MTKAQKLRTLLAMVECVPAASAMTVFESAARRGDLSAFWDHYQEVLERSTDEGELKVAANGAVSFKMIEPAMQAMYDLPTVMGTTSLDSDNVAHPSFSRSAS